MNVFRVVMLSPCEYRGNIMTLAYCRVKRQPIEIQNSLVPTGVHHYEKPQD